MTTKEYFDYIVEQIHFTVVATVDEDGLPVTCVIDMMYADDNGLYFLTAKGKNFYRRLKDKGYLALSGKKGEDTMRQARTAGDTAICHKISACLILSTAECEAVTFYWLLGEVEPLSAAFIYLKDGQSLPAFFSRIYLKHIRIFLKQQREHILSNFSDFATNRNCGTVHGPQSCIELNGKAVIRQENCLHCGNCAEVCPVGAVIRR